MPDNITYQRGYRGRLPLADIRHTSQKKNTKNNTFNKQNSLNHNRQLNLVCVYGKSQAQRDKYSMSA